MLAKPAKRSSNTKATQRSEVDPCSPLQGVHLAGGGAQHSCRCPSVSLLFCISPRSFSVSSNWKDSKEINVLQSCRSTVLALNLSQSSGAERERMGVLSPGISIPGVARGTPLRLAPILPRASCPQLGLPQRSQSQALGSVCPVRMFFCDPVEAGSGVAGAWGHPPARGSRLWV